MSNKVATVVALALQALTPVATGEDFLFPLEEGASVICTQGPGGSTSHSGLQSRFALDFAAPAGTIVRAAADGRAYVTFDAPPPGFVPPPCCPRATSGGFGNFVAIDHEDGTFTLYAHLKTVVGGIDGSFIRRGERIGTVNSTGLSSGDHLHFSLQRGSVGSVYSSMSESMDIRVRENGVEKVLRAVDFQCGRVRNPPRYSSPGIVEPPPPPPPPPEGPPGEYIGFGEGDPGVPGDGVRVSSAGGTFDFDFDAATPINLGSVNTLTLTVFFGGFQSPNYFNPGFTVAGVGRPANGESCRTVFGSGLPRFTQTYTVNGVVGYTSSAVNFGVAMAQAAEFHNPGCAFSPRDLSITRFVFFTPPPSVDTLQVVDALAVDY